MEVRLLLSIPTRLGSSAYSSFDLLDETATRRASSDKDT